MTKIAKHPASSSTTVDSIECCRPSVQLGTMSEPRPLVEVLEWSPEWAKSFAAAQAELLPVVPEATIEHIGSTSVPGLAAKPIIDLMMITERLAEIACDPSRIGDLGYEFRPALFADDPDHLFFVRDTDGVRTEHLHVIHPRSPKPQADRDFRDYLSSHPDAVRRYAEAKWTSAAANPHSRREYGDGKLAVLETIAAEARAWAAARDQGTTIT